MAHDQNRQIGRAIISALMGIIFATFGAGQVHLQIAVQQRPLAAFGAAAGKAARLVADLDADADGQLSTAELLAKPVPPEAFGRADTNADGVIDQAEATTAAERPQGHDGHRGHRGHPEQGAVAEPAAPAN